MDKPQFIWTQDYSVGIKEIDEQHQHFFGVANAIVENSGKNISRDSLLQSLGELGDYTFYHFSTEESYFDKFNYEDAPQHIVMHNQFREKIKGFLDQARDEKADIQTIAQDMATYSGNWLLGHIVTFDKKYTVYFQDHGLK